MYEIMSCRFVYFCSFSFLGSTQWLYNIGKLTLGVKINITILIRQLSVNLTELVKMHKTDMQTFAPRREVFKFPTSVQASDSFNPKNITQEHHQYISNSSSEKGKHEIVKYWFPQLALINTAIKDMTR